MAENLSKDSIDGVAIIGMAGRFPGASDIHALWQNLCNSSESITFFSDDELDPSIDQALKNNKNYIRARGTITNVDKFDAAFFGMSPREAEIMDPQQRIFLEVSWEALENGGYDPERFGGLIGVFGGTGFNTYFINHVMSHQDIIESFGQHQVELGNAPDYLATRVSFKLNLKGPSVSMYTGCSTSLVAVCHAFDSLMSYQCDMALAGGTFIVCPQNSGYLYQEGEIFSIDGHCRPFDANAHGTVFGNGAGVVLLKRLEEAIEDRDYIYAVIHGTAMNNDGSNKMSYTAPSVDGQAEVIAMAHANANVSPESISYIETHGTGTLLGDPIEIEALNQAMLNQSTAKHFCALGSLKSNIGHLDAAAGVAGLIKTALMLKQKMLVPSIHFEKPNPQIDFTNSPFYVNTEVRKWESDSKPLRAGVSSFGVGGTNAHVVLQEPPDTDGSGISRPWQMIPLSAKNKYSLDMMTKNLANHLKENSDLSLSDIAYTLQTGRKFFNQRRMIVCHNIQDTIDKLETLDSKRDFTASNEPLHRDIVFMFSGQASEYIAMGLDLYRTEKTFQQEVDRCAEILKPHLSYDIRDVLYPSDRNLEEAQRKLKLQSFIQTSLFVIEYALAKLWISWGINPVGLVGHSIGEYTAACLAGVFSLQDALLVVASRGQLMEQLPPGRMLAVFLPTKDIEKYLHENLSLALINGPALCVVSGEIEAIETLQKSLSHAGIDHRQLHTKHAFHSTMTDPILSPFAAKIKHIKLNPPRIPLMSNVTGTWITGDDATNPDYWVKHLRQTIRFSDCIEELMKESRKIFLEIGPGQTLSTLAGQHPTKTKDHVIVSSMRHPNEQISDIEFILNTVGQLWLAGTSIDWAQFYSEEQRCRIPLPGYQFERKYCWLTASKRADSTTSTPIPLDVTPEFSRSDLKDMEQQPDDTNIIQSVHDIENIIADIWRDLLGFDSIGIHDDFFALGGNSLIAVRLFSRIERIFNKRLPLATLFEAPTIEKLSHVLFQEDFTPSWASLVEIQPKGSRPPFFCVHAEGGNVLEYYPLAKYLGADQPFYGLQAQGLKGDEIKAPTIPEMAADYIKEIKKVQPQGPYYIGGYCLGGLITFEMIHQLQNNGDKVAYVVMISTSTPDHLRSQQPHITAFQRSIYRFIERIELELSNLSALTLKEKKTYIGNRTRKMLEITQVHTEDVIDKFSSKFYVKKSGHSREYNLHKLIELTDKAYMDYDPKPYQDSMVLIRPNKQPRERSTDPTLGWSELLKGGIRNYEVHAFHKNILLEPNVKAVAEILCKTLKDAQKSNN